MRTPSPWRSRRVLDPRPLALALAGVLLLLAAASSRGAGGPEYPLPSAGVAVSVGVDDRTVLVATAGGFDLLVLDTEAVIVDGHGRGIGLDAVRAGDRLAYVVTPWAGMSLAPVLRDLGQPTRRERDRS